MLNTKVMDHATSRLSGKWRVKFLQQGGYIFRKKMLPIIQVERILSYHNTAGDYIETNFWEDASVEGLTIATDYVGIVDKNEQRVDDLKPYL